MSDDKLRAAIRAGADGLRTTHWDGKGCGTNGAGGCSRCYGPSPADADEVAEDVIEAAWPILRAELEATQRECAELNDALDAMRMTADEVQARQRGRVQAGAWAQAAAAVQQATDRSSA